MLSLTVMRESQRWRSGMRITPCCTIGSHSGESNDAEPIPLWRLVAKRAACVNTTAAGGNASLMTLSE